MTYKKNVFTVAVIIIIIIIIMIVFGNFAYAIDATIASILNDIVKNETWVHSQALSNGDIKYTNDPSYIVPPSCSYDKPVVIISNYNNIAFLSKNFGDSKEVRMVFKAAKIPANDSTNNPLKSGLRNNNATNKIEITGEEVTVDAKFKKSLGDENWELYINGSQLDADKVFVLDRFVIDNVDYNVYDSAGNNIKSVSGGGSAASDYGSATYSRKETYQTFDHKAEYQVDISSDSYNVKESIPTSEEVKTSGWIDNSDYHIKVRTTTYYASIKDAKIKASVSYSWGKYETVNGERVWKQQGSNTYEASESVSVSVQPKVYYDVPVSDTAILIGGEVNASDSEGKYSIGSCTIPAAGIMGSGPSAINFKENFVKIDKEYNLTGAVGGSGAYSSESSARSAASSEAQSLIETKKNELIQILLKSFTGDQDAINYKFCGLKVDKDGVSRNA